MFLGSFIRKYIAAVYTHTLLLSVLMCCARQIYFGVDTLKRLFDNLACRNIIAAF